MTLPPTKVNPPPNWSATVKALVDASGPAFVTVTVNVTVSPGVIVPLGVGVSASIFSATVLVSDKSEIGSAAVASSSSVVELSPGVLLGSRFGEPRTWA